MRSALKATAMLGSSSLVTLVLGLVTAKVWARLIGPAGYGHIGLLSSTVTLISIVAELGLGTTIVRPTAVSIASDDRAEILAIWRSATLILLPLLAVIAIGMAIFRDTLAGFVLGQSGRASEILCVIVMLCFGVTANLRTGLLNAHHKVKALATMNIALNVVGTITALAFVVPLGTAGIAPSLAVSAAVRWVVVFVVLRQTTGLTFPHARAKWQHVRALLKHGLPVTGSMVVGPGVQILLPVVILHLVGEGSVGQYQAANTIAITLIGFLLVSMGQDFYPRVSAVGDDLARLKTIAHDQHRLMLLLGLPLLLGIKWGSGWAVPLLLSPAFAPVIDILSWHLLGEMLRFSSVVFAYIVLARFSGLAFFGPALVNGIALYLGTVLLVPACGVQGVGMAFAITQAVYLVLVASLVRWRFGWAFGGDGLLIAAGLLALVAPNFLPRGGMLRFSVELSLALCAAAYSLWRLLAMWRSSATTIQETKHDQPQHTDA